MFAQKDGHLMKAGQWALAQGGEPIIIWDKKPEIDPDFYIDPDEEDESKFSSFDSIENQLFFTAFENMQEKIKCDPEYGFELIQSAKIAGFKNGCFAAWLCHKLGEYLTKHPVPD